MIRDFVFIEVIFIIYVKMILISHLALPILEVLFFKYTDSFLSPFYMQHC